MPLSKSPTRQKFSQLRPQHEWAFEAIGTHFWIGLYQPCPTEQLSSLQAAITARIDAFDKTYSRFRSDSLVTRMSRAAGTYRLPADAAKMIALYEQLYVATGGRVTPLIGQALADAGYDAEYSLQPKPLRPVPEWPAVCSYQRGELTLTQPALLDFGAAGKGYLVDLLTDIIQGAGVRRFCIDGSGDLRCVGLDVPLAAGLENPHDTDQIIGVARLSSGALCGSSGARRSWGDYNHILDPQLLVSPQRIAAVWVVADSCMLADGLTTALYFTAPEMLKQQFSFAYAILLADGSLTYSSDFPAELFIVKDKHV